MRRRLRRGVHRVRGHRRRGHHHAVPSASRPACAPRSARVHVTHEPSSGPSARSSAWCSPSGSSCRAASTPRSMALLFAADRLDHIECEIAAAPARRLRRRLRSLRPLEPRPTSRRPRPAARADMLAWIRTLNQHARRPDVTVVLDVSPDVAAARRRARGGARELFDDRRSPGQARRRVPPRRRAPARRSLRPHRRRRRSRHRGSVRRLGPGTLPVI